jgi:hypothetical protein
MTADELITRVFEIAHAAPDAESEARKETLWVIGVTLLADVLLSKDEIEREKLLNGLWRELRAALADIPEIVRTGQADMKETRRFYDERAKLN